ncbi:MAG: molybdopterin-dependent oxidoreductase, partial [Bdellovibrionales bacterium]|nr:molybdopterin-dependent oxidoreductase [Bdellovibrionales bacterium]
KAEPLGPTVILDGERCIMCTRCIRFCDEVTETGELGMLNRGDRSVISINPGRELDNPFSGTVVDLCPVGALTHRKWRFNTRIWYTDQKETICPGCSTGCNVKVAARDGKVVHVKARLNSEVNKEWLCDEGRYGFDRFIPEARLTEPLCKGESASWDDAVAASQALSSGKTLVLLAPDLLLEEFAVAAVFVEQVVGDADVVVAYRERTLTEVEAVLISPDYAANFRGAEFLGLVSGDLEEQYTQALGRLEQGAYDSVLVLGDHALCAQDQEQSAYTLAITQASCSVGVLSDARSKLTQACSVVLPARPFLEKSGMMINRKSRLQYARQAIEPRRGTEPSWRILGRLAQGVGKSIVEARTERDLTLSLLEAEPRFQGLRIAKIAREGGCLHSNI